MGSFNTTCAISKSPILYGQKAYVFFLVYDSFDTYYQLKEKNFFSNSFNGSSNKECEHFSIIGYPLLATYKDYNIYEFEDKDLELLTLNNIKKIHIPNTKSDGFNGYNNCHDYLDVDDINDMEQLQKIEHSGSLRVKTYNGISFISKMAIHKDIYEKIILKHTENHCYLKYNELKHNINLNKLQDFLIKLNNHNNKSIDEIFNSLNESNKRFIMFNIKWLENNLDKTDKKGNLITKEYIKKEKEYLILNSIKSSFFYDDNLKFIYSLDQYNKNYEENQHNDFIKLKIIKKFSELYIMSLWFNHYNFEFIPVIIGSNDSNYEDHYNMFLKLSNIIASLDSYNNNEECLEYENLIEFKIKKRILIKNIEKTFFDWFGRNKEEYDESEKIFFYYLNLIKNGDIKSFEIGDESEIDLFFKENNLISNFKDGDIIEFYN